MSNDLNEGQIQGASETSNNQPDLHPYDDQSKQVVSCNSHHDVNEDSSVLLTYVPLKPRDYDPPADGYPKSREPQYWGVAIV